VLRLTLTEGADGTVLGTAVRSGTETEVEVTGLPLCGSTFGTVDVVWNRPLGGTAAALAFSGESIDTTVPGTVTNTIAFAGALRDGIIAGTLTQTNAQRLENPDPQVASVTGGGSASFSLTLR
jgi:hypothetical protein